MSKVKIRNIARDLSPVYCTLAYKKTSFSLMHGDTKYIEENLLTGYLKRRASLGYLSITPVEEKTEKFSTKNKKVVEKSTENKEV